VNNFDSNNAEFRRAIDLLADGIDCERLDRFLGELILGLTRLLNLPSAVLWLHDVPAGKTKAHLMCQDGKIVQGENSGRMPPVSPLVQTKEIWERHLARVPFVASVATAAELLHAERSKLSDEGISAVLWLPLVVGGESLGALTVHLPSGRELHDDAQAQAQALANHASLALHMAHLSELARQKAQQVAVIDERNRLAREVHDTLAQGFTGVIIQLEAAKGAMVRSDLADLKDRIERASDLARSSLGEARRSVRALRPRPLIDGTLCGALENFLKTMTNGTELNAEFVVEGETRQIPPE
jgi:signal transduction histidine kinase